MNWSFIQHATDHLSKPRFGEQKQPTLWPSSATAEIDGKVLGKCRRQNFLRYAKDNYAFQISTKTYLKSTSWYPTIRFRKRLLSMDLASR